MVDQVTRRLSLEYLIALAMLILSTLMLLAVVTAVVKISQLSYFATMFYLFSGGALSVFSISIIVYKFLKGKQEVLGLVLGIVMALVSFSVLCVYIYAIASIAWVGH